MNTIHYDCARCKKRIVPDEYTVLGLLHVHLNSSTQGPLVEISETLPLCDPCFNHVMGGFDLEKP